MKIIKKYNLNAYYTEKELNKMIGTFIEDDSDYKVVNEDCDCFYEGQFVCKLRKGVFDRTIVKDYGKLDFAYNNNRGVSAGKLDEELVSKVDTRDFKKLSDYKYVRLNKNGTESKFHLSNPVKSNILGYFDYMNYIVNENGTKSRVRSIKTTSNTNEETLNQLEELTRVVDKQYRKCMTEKYEETKAELDSYGFQEYLYGDTLFTTITVNTDFRTALHKDSNNANKIGCLAVSSQSDRGFTGGELYLPKYKVKLNLEPGDLLIFHSAEWHTNNKIEGDRFSFVYYIRENIVKSYKENESSNISRDYTNDLFIDFNKKCIVLNKDGDLNYNKYKNEICEYSMKHNLLIYRESTKTSFNRRKFNNIDNMIRYVSKRTISLTNT